MKRALLFILSVLIVLNFCSCNGGSTAVTETSDAAETQPEVEKISLSLTGELNYKIIRPEFADKEIIACATSLWNGIHEITGSFIIGLNEDFVKTADLADNDNLEILLGLTNRPESREAAGVLPTYMDYSITVTGSKVVIYANTAERLQEAVDYFITKLNFSSGVLTYSNDKTYIGTYDYKYKNLTLCGEDISKFIIIVPADAERAETAFAEKLAVWIACGCGYKPEIADDSIAVAENEIIIGKTNRPASKEFTDGTTTFKTSECAIKTSSGNVVLAAGTTAGYNVITNKLAGLLNEGNGSLTAGIDRLFQSDTLSIDGCKIMFVGNSLTYYGECVYKTNTSRVDDGYFYKVAKEFGDKVTVLNYTYAGAFLWHNSKEMSGRQVFIIR